MRLVLLKNINLITSNRELESCGQDLRLWSSDADQQIVTLMFYTNSRSAYPPKCYYTKEGKRHIWPARVQEYSIKALFLLLALS